MIKVPPPVPAPYLQAVPPLPDDVLRLMDRKRLKPSERSRLRRELNDRLARVIAARKQYEADNGVEISPEPEWRE